MKPEDVPNLDAMEPEELRASTSKPFVSGRMDSYSPKRNEMREAEWQWRYGMQRERPPVREVLPDMHKTVAAILARRTA